MDLQEAYRTMQAASGIEVGDTVKILRAPETADELGWRSDYRDDALKHWRTIGDKGVVDRINERGIHVEGIDGARLRRDYYPFFCLELIAKGQAPIKIGDYTAEITEKGIKVGCQDIDWETYDKIGERRPK